VRGEGRWPGGRAPAFRWTDSMTTIPRRMRPSESREIYPRKSVGIRYGYHYCNIEVLTKLTHNVTKTNDTGTVLNFCTNLRPFYERFFIIIAEEEFVCLFVSSFVRCYCVLHSSDCLEAMFRIRLITVMRIRILIFN
jgi:hypothetical protein